MFEEYKHHNLFWGNVDRFLQEDPQLSPLTNLRFVHPLDWWKGIDWKEPGIYLLTGGRQIGKTTSTKLLMKQLLLKQAFPAENIFYLPCDQIDNHQLLGRIIRRFLEEHSLKKGAPFLLVIDEVTYVTEWDRAIKALADEGWFRKGFLIITGSDSIVLREAMNRFPGRRGEATKTDFHLHPLRFREYIELVDSKLLQSLDDEVLFIRFEEYLRCGGHLRAINDLHLHGEILEATYAVFEQWIRGDFDKHGKSSHYLLGLLQTLIETAGSQVTYSALTHRMGEISKETFIDYCSLLERLDILFSLQAFDQNKKIGFPKKARKIHFWDPFIFDTIQRMLEQEGLLSKGKDFVSVKVEAVVAANYKALFPTYYMKGKGEIDVIVVREKRIVPLEVKWTGGVRSFDVSELKKYSGALILTKNSVEGIVGGISTMPLPRYLVLSKENY